MKTRWMLFCTLSTAAWLCGCNATKNRANVLRAAPPISAFERPAASAPKTPFRIVWQQVDLKNASFSPDGKFLVKRHANSSSLVSIATQRFARRVAGHPYTQMTLTPATKTARLPAKIRQQLQHGDRVETLSNKAKLVAIRGYQSKVFSLTSGRKLWELKTSAYGPQVFLGFSPDGKWAMTHETDKEHQNEKHYLRDAQTGKILRRYAWPSSFYDAPFGFSADSRRFGVFDHGVKFYEMPSGRQIFRYDGFRYGAGALAFSRDGHSVITADGGEESVFVWNVESGRIARFWHAKYNASGALAMSNDGKFLAAGSDGSCGRDLLRVWDFKSGKELWVAPSGYNSWGVNDVQWSPDGTLLACLSANGPPQIWNAKTGQRIAVLGGKAVGKGTQVDYDDESARAGDRAFFWSSDARELWIGGAGGINVWSREGKILRTLDTVKDIGSMARCPSGQRVIIGTDSGEIVLWNVKENKVSWRRRVSDKAQNVAFLPSDRVLSWQYTFEESSAIMDEISVWDAKGGFTTQTLPVALGLYRLAVSRDGTRLIASGKDGLTLWDSAPKAQ